MASLLSQPPPPQPDPQVAALRAASMPTVATIDLFGDTILRGFALQRPPEQVKSDDPLSHFKSPSSLANLLLSENRIPLRVQFSGHLMPSKFAAACVAARLAAGGSRAIVLADGGEHNCDPDAYQAEWEAIVSVATNVPVVMMSMFDYPPAPRNCRYSQHFGARTMNDATYAAFQTLARKNSRAIWIDMKSKMDEFRVTLQKEAGAAAIHYDGIHPTALGQLYLIGTILRALEIKVPTAWSLMNHALASWDLFPHEPGRPGLPRWSEARLALTIERCLP
jgi:hypothetical protein